MLENVISLLNTQLETTGYFREIFGLAEQKKFDNESRPQIYCSNGEWKPVTNFDESNGLSYWRLNSKVTFQDSDAKSMVPNDKLVTVRMPLRLVAVVKRDLMSVDNEFNPEILGRSIFAVLLKNLNGVIRRNIGANTINMSLNDMDLSSQSILNAEFGGNKITDIKTKMVIVAINLTINIDVRQSCINLECPLVDACTALLQSLSDSQKNNCILPSYDFTSSAVYNNLTDQQREDLITLLCTSSGDCDSIDITNSNDSYNQNILCVQSPFELPDTTYDIYVNGVFNQSVSLPTLGDAVLNINA
jgi:hypothetical protein